MVTATRTAYEIAAQTPDPELPVVTIGDLGILRAVDQSGDGVLVTITPTYSGCPAMREIAADVVNRLRGHGVTAVTVRFALAPAWTTDWITPDGRRKLAEAGIAPPGPAPALTGSAPVPISFGLPAPVRCPRCGAQDTTTVAVFGSTACKSLHRCRACEEPFEGMKAL